MYFKTDKNKNYIKNCESIIKQNGSCDGFSCEDCPILSWHDGGKYCIDGNGENEYDAHLEGAKEYLKLIKGEKEMTKSDLKDGMVVELRNGDKRLVLFESFIENSNWDRFCEYTENLINNSHERRDVVKIYTTIGRLFNNIFEDRNLTLIWERKEKSEAEIKLDTIEKQIEKLQKSAKELREVINNG